MAQRARDVETLRRSQVRWDFLAIDSSADVRNEVKQWTHFGENLSLGQMEWMMLRGITAGNVDRLAQRKDVAEWIGNRDQIRSFLEKTRIEGANQRRRFGRLLFAQNADDIRTALFTDKVGNFTKTGTQQCAFHIFASLGGGERAADASSIWWRAFAPNTSIAASMTIPSFSTSMPPIMRAGPRHAGTSTRTNSPPCAT